MRFLLLACTLLVAGATAELLVAGATAELLVPGATAETQDAAPTQTGIIELWILNAIDTFNQWIVDNRYDPLFFVLFHFDETILDNVIHARGQVENLNVTGFSSLYASYVNFNIFIGRLDCDLRWPEICITFDRYFVDLAMGHEGGQGELSGSVCIRGIRVNIDSLMRLDPGPRIHIFNINSDLTIEEIKGTFIAGWRDRFNPVLIDVTDRVNNFVNVGIPAFFKTYRREIGTILAEAMRRAVNRYW